MFKAAGEALVFLVIGLIVSPAVISCGGDRNNQKDNTEFTTDDDDVNVINVVESADPNADWDCESECECYTDYLTFIELTGAYSHPISEQDLEEQFDDIASLNTPLIEEQLSEDELRDALITNMNIGFLREDIDERLLQVVTTDLNEYEDYYERKLLFIDPYVGTFKGILLTPKSSGPHPGVVAIHGHWDNAEIFKVTYYGDMFPSRGYAILMLTMRNMCVDEFENLFTRSMLLSGFTAMGVRSYETLLGLKYLRYIPEVDENRIGLIGHSGGSVTNNLTIRTENLFKAMVTDCTGEYTNMGDGSLIDEAAPSLWPYHMLINDFSTSSTPIMPVPYGFTGLQEEIFQFFYSTL